MSHKSWISGFLFCLLSALCLYNVRCSEYAKKALENERDGEERSGNDGRISLAFVFDRTGSMYDDLVQVRAGATRIFNSTIQNGTSSVKNYILVPFRDPDVGPAFETENPVKFLKALNDIYVRGGKDCPEMSVTAIKQALELCLPGSVVYVFTDAEAKDHQMLPDVIRLIRQKNIRVNFILSGNCGLEKDFKDKNTYEKISIFSSGQIVNLNKSEVGSIWDFVKISINPNRRNIYSVDKFTRGEKTYFIQLNRDIKEAVFTVTGEDVEVIIRDSWGALVSLQDKNVDVLLNLNSIMSVLVMNPKPGNWSITVRSNGRQTLRVEAVSDRWEGAESDHTVVVIPEVDECKRGIHDCSSEEECLDLPYAFTCVTKCPRGFEMTKRDVCIDVEECLRHEGICGDRKCENIPGSYRCKKICPKGFEGRGNECKDINECLQDPYICGNQECINTEGSHVCRKKCLRGYIRDKDGVCKDVDECSKYPSICGRKECFNIQRSYRCLEKCPRGYNRDARGVCEDVNECSQSPTICGNGECRNTPGSYQCEEKCRRGYSRHRNGSCKDVNECTKNSRICADQECINIPGSYRCQKKCSEGFLRDEHGNCKDIDECAQQSTLCGDQDCLNLQGSYRCQEKCLDGFERDRDGYCIDVDECSEQTQRCQFMCENTIGNYQCLCPRGKRLQSDGMTCSSVSACPLRGYGRCQHQCNAETGRCECPSGYTLHWDGVSCIDNNECSTREQKCGSRQCFNTLGKYHCLNVSCPVGYYPTTDGYCTMQCFYQDNLCSYIKLQHTSISIPRYLPVNTDFLQLHPYIPPSGGLFERLACYCATYFYPVENSNHLFGVYQIGQVGILYNRVVFDEPGFYQFQVVSDYLSNGNIVSRTTFHVFLDVADYTF